MNNKLLSLAYLLLGLGAAACQSQSVSTATTAAVGNEAAGAPVISGQLVALGAAPATSADTLRLLQALDLAPLWAGTVQGKPAESVMDGVYGDDNYHIAFYFDSVRRDARQPTLYHVWGRERFKHVTTSFAGTCTAAHLRPLPDTADLQDSRRLRAYTAVASFDLEENPAAKGAGRYTGQAYLDFCVDAAGHPQPCNFVGMDTGSGNPTKGSGLLFRGTWQSKQTNQTKPVAWAAWYEVIVPDALRKLGLGERGAELSPKLAQYGWGEKWENEEWWAASPKSISTL